MWNLTATENRLVVAKGREWGMAEMGEGGQKGTNFQLHIYVYTHTHIYK